MLSIVNGVTTVYIGDYYEYEVGTGITRSYYGHGAATRLAGGSDPEAIGVYYLLKDHTPTADLRSALSIALRSPRPIRDDSGNAISKMRIPSLPIP